MQPLLNLKSFLALFVILAVPGALLVAYFRNYSADADSMRQGHDMGGKSSGMTPDHHTDGGHGEKNGEMPMKSHSEISSGGKNEKDGSMSDEKMQGGADMAAQSPMEDSGPPALLHIGAKGFFLDRPQTFTPLADQAKALSEIKERSTMAMMDSDKKIQKAEQQLWKITAAEKDQLAEIEAKVREIEKLRSDQRIAFIVAVTEAVRLLAPEQKEELLRRERSPKMSTTAPEPSSPATKETAPHPH